MVAAPKFYRCGKYLYSGDGASPRLKRDEVATVLGIPEKLSAGGSRTWPLYQSGGQEDIRNGYTHTVLTITLIYRQYALHRGWWTEDQRAIFTDSISPWLDKQTGPMCVTVRETLPPLYQQFDPRPENLATPQYLTPQ